MDRVLDEIAASQWEELQMAHYLINHQDAWPHSKDWDKPARNPWRPPTFATKTRGGRRRLSGQPY